MPRGKYHKLGVRKCRRCSKYKKVINNFHKLGFICFTCKNKSINKVKFINKKIIINWD